MMQRRIPAVVLAGGRASRMGGGDKPLLDLGGRTMLGHLLDRLRPQVGPIAINANGDPSRYAAWGLPVIADPVGGQPGPLAGILAAMRWATEVAPDQPAVFTVPGDTPFLPLDTVARLAAAAGCTDAAIDAIACAATAGRTHPVVALWPLRLADALARSLASGERRVGVWATEHGARPTDFATHDGDPFANINTPEDLAAARRRMG